MPRAAIERRPPSKPMPARFGRRPGPAQIVATNDEDLDEEVDEVDDDQPAPAAKKAARKKA